MQFHHFGDLPPNGMQGVQRSHRFLEDHRDLAAADTPHLNAFGIKPDDVDGLGAAFLPLEDDLAVDDFAGGAT